MSPVYDRLETNIPRGLMGFSDLAWPDHCQLFPGHEAVLEYIERYSEDVRHLVQFDTQVLHVRSTADKRWHLGTRQVNPSDDAEVIEHVFDAVVVANGHFNVPYIPSVPGIEDWHRAYPRSICHSKFYRAPEHYAGKKVVVVGNSASGIDIAAQLRTICEKPLILSSRTESFLQPDPSADQIEKPRIVRFEVENRTVVFEDGSREADVDAILYCTGYFYNFPFLESLDPPITQTGERCQNLYQHIFYRPNPTLAFPALNQKVIPFPIAEAQGAVIARVFSGRLSLPGEREMEDWEERALRDSASEKDFHVLKFPKDADYLNMLHDWATAAEVGKVDSAGLHPRGDEQPADYAEPSVGKRPPYWGEREYWTRERFPAIKKAFQALGEGRHGIRTLKEVGFDFAEWEMKEVEGV